MDEVPRYRKKKPQISKSAKRADHKHKYEKSILIVSRTRDEPVTISVSWAEFCSVCGRFKRRMVGLPHADDEVFVKPEYRGRNLWWSYDMYRPVDEIIAEFPDFPVYTNDPDDYFTYIRIR